MLSFKQYVARKDETSYNPMDRMDLTKHDPSLARTAMGVAATPIAAAAAAGQIMPTWRNWSRGNPYASADGRLAHVTFEKSRNWLVNFLKTLRSPKFNTYLLGVLDEAEKYLNQTDPMQVQGVTMGKTASTASKIAAPLATLIATAGTALKNVYDTAFSVAAPDEIQKVVPTVKTMLQALDAIAMASGRDRALDRVHEFRHVLEAGEGSDAFDADAQFHKPFFSR